MAISYLQQHEIDKEKWDIAVQSHRATASPFALSWYLDASCDNWDALIANDYTAVMPLPYRKKWGKYYIYPPYFLPRLGVFGKEITSDELARWINAIPDKFRWIDIVLHEQMPFDNKKWLSTTHKTYVLDCQFPYEQIRKNYHHNHKRNCQKAKEEGLTIIHDFSYEEAIALFRNHQTKFYKVNYQEQDYKRLINILTTLKEKRHLEVYGVVDAHNTFCAAAFFPFINGKYYFLFSGRKADVNKSMFFLIDNFIRRHAGTTCLLDFNGSNQSSLARFYAGFGADEIQFSQITISRLSAIAEILLSFYRKFK